MKISLNKIIFVLFNLMIILLTIPYVFCGKMVFDNPTFFYNYINSSEIILPSHIKALIYIKDIICAILFVCVIFKEKKNLLFITLLFSLGIITLTLNGLFSPYMILAGYRAFSFAIVTESFFRTYKEKYNKSEHPFRLIKLLHLTFYIETFTVILQIVLSNHLMDFGSGGSRFSGLFNGSGNLGCYGIGMCLFFAVLKNKYNYYGNYKYLILLFISLFLTIASGTRTCMFICLLITVFEILFVFGKKLRLKREIIVLLLLLFFLLFGNNMQNSILEWTNRGDLSISGIGRIDLFVSQVSNSNIFQLLFGYGIGVGTNASISLGLLNTQISDSTINLIFTQFGFVGLSIFIALLFSLIRNLFKNGKNKNTNLYLFVSIIIMFIVGNLFEHNAMCVLFIIVYESIVKNWNLRKDTNENN